MLARPPPRRSMAPDHLTPWIALSLLPGIGPITARRALEVHGDPSDLAFRLSPSGWAEVPGVDRATVEQIVASRPTLARRVEAEWKLAVRSDARIVTRDDPDYPTHIAALPDAPCVLYLKGGMTEGRVRVAMVGSRRATA